MTRRRGRRLPNRLLARVPTRYRRQVPPEIPELWRDPAAFGVLIASVVAMFTLAIFPPYFSPGAESIQTALKDDPASLGLIALLGIAIGAGAILIGGAVGDTGGHRRWLIVGLVGLLASCLLGMALGEDGLITAALLGAFFSGFGMPMGVAVIADAYQERFVRDIGIGLVLGSFAVAQIVAPIIQDVLHDAVGLFAIWIVPSLGVILSLWLVRRNVPDTPVPDDVARRDLLLQVVLAGVPLTLAAMIILLLPSEVDLLVIAGFVVLGAIAAVGALVRRRRGHGVWPARGAPGRMILVAMFVGVFMSFAVTAPLHYFGSFLRVVRFWQEIPAVLALLPHLVPLFLGGLWAPLLAYRFGYVRVILFAMALLAGSTALFAMASADTGYLWFVVPLGTLGLGMIFGATARAGLIMSRMPRSLPGLANALNLAAMELGAILGATVMTVLVMRTSTERYAELLAGAGLSGTTASDAVSAFREALRSVAPGGTTEIAPEVVDQLLPGFRAAMADGIAFSLWLVTIVMVVATLVAAVLFRWARGKDERPDDAFDPDAPGGGVVTETATGTGGTPPPHDSASG